MTDNCKQAIAALAAAKAEYDAAVAKAHPGRDPEAAARGGDLRAGAGPGHRSRPAAAGRAGRGRGGAVRPAGVQRAHRADSGYGTKRDRDGVPREHSGAKICVRSDSRFRCGRTPTRRSRRGMLHIDFELRSVARAGELRSGGQSVSAADRRADAELREGGRSRAARWRSPRISRCATRIDPAHGDTARIIAQRETRRDRDSSRPRRCWRIRRGAAAQGAAAQAWSVLFDNSLSMQWEKLERSFAAARRCCARCGPRIRST